LISKIIRLNSFKKDYKRMLSRGKDVKKLDTVLGILISGMNLEAK